MDCKQVKGKKQYITLFFLKKTIIYLSCILMMSCSFYSLSNVSLSPRIKSFEVGFFRNKAIRIIPGIDQQFTNALQDLILNQTNLELVNQDGHLIYEGEITKYEVVPTSNTSNEDRTSAQNRMTINVQLRFTNTIDENENLEKSFSYFFDFNANQTEDDVMTQALETIYNQITQNIIDATLAKW